MRVIIIGGGEVGFSIARHLAEEKIDVLMIEQREECCKRARENLDIQVHCGNGASPRVLEEAGVDSAAILIAVTNSDEVNIVACAVAARLNKSIRRIARLRDIDYLEHIEKAGSEHLGVDLVFNLDIEAARGIMDLLDAPTADAVRFFADDKLRLTGYHVQSGAPIMGRSLISLAGEYNLQELLIVAIDRDGHVIIPRGNDVIQEGDFLWFIAGPGQLQVASQLVGKTYHSLKRVMISGGTTVGFHLAQMLEERKIPCKIIEEDRERAEELAEKLEETIVINGRGIDISLLREENVADVSAFVATTSQDEDNILAAMLAHREGVARVIAMIERFEYAKVVGSIGINALVSKNVAAVATTLNLIRKGKILSSCLLGRDAEVIEYQAMETSQITKAPLKDLNFPKGAILGAIVRDGEVIIPSGDDQVLVGDRILIFTTKAALKKVERLTTVALGFF